MGRYPRRLCQGRGLTGDSHDHASRALYSTVAPDGVGPLVSLELIHSHWERLGDKAKAARRGYPIGWAYVLSLYADRHGPLVISLDLIGRLAMTIGRLRRAG